MPMPAGWRDVDRWHSIRPLPDGGAVTIALMQVGPGLEGRGWLIWRRFPRELRRAPEILAGPLFDYREAFKEAEAIAGRLEADAATAGPAWPMPPRWI